MALKTKAFGELITFARATGGGRFNAAGQYEWLPANEPRIDYDPVTGECRGILIEEQRTNLLLRSAEFDITWQQAAASVSANAANAPDGTVSADKLIANTTSTNHFVSQTAALADNTIATFSFFAKAAEYSQVRVNLRDKAGVFRSSIVSLVGGAVVVAPSSGLTVSVSGAGNGWFRIFCALNFGSGATAPAFYIYPAVNGTDFFAGDGTSGIFIWGAQLEAGAFPTSYIPTTTAQVTRAADVCSVNNLSPWYRADEGTLMVEALVDRPSGLDPIAVVGIGDGLDGNRIQLRVQTNIIAALRVVSGGRQYNQTISSANLIGGLSRLAASFSSGAQSFSVKGLLVNVEAPVTAMPLVTMLEIGKGAASSILKGHIRRIRYIPRRISDTELQALTAL